LSPLRLPIRHAGPGVTYTPKAVRALFGLVLPRRTRRAAAMLLIAVRIALWLGCVLFVAKLR